MSKKYSSLLTVLFAFTMLSVLISLFLPYLVRLNIRGGDVTMPTVYNGYHFEIAWLVLLIMVASLFSLIFFKRQLITLLLGFTVLIATYFLRFSIHFQGFIDHDYDSKTGLGFLILFSAVIAHFSISLVAFLLERRNRKRE